MDRMGRIFTATHLAMLADSSFDKLRTNGFVADIDGQPFDKLRTGMGRMFWSFQAYSFGKLRVGSNPLPGGEGTFARCLRYTKDGL